MTTLKDMTIAIIGYGSQGRSQALNLRDSGMNVIIGIRPGKSKENAKKDKFEVSSINNAVKIADIIHILLPDEIQKEMYEEHIKPHLTSQKILSFSHGFNIVFNQIIPPSNIGVFMVSPKVPGISLRESYKKNEQLPGIYAIHQDVSRTTKLAKEFGQAVGLNPLFKCSFKEETFENLFTEQNLLCGGLPELIKKSSEVLLEKGYPPELVYYGGLYQLKFIIDILLNGGFESFTETISNTAEFGANLTGPKIIDDKVKEIMKKTLEEIEDGTFLNKFLNEKKTGFKNLKEGRNKISMNNLDRIRKSLKLD